jgi:hypothetical protein
VTSSAGTEYPLNASSTVRLAFTGSPADMTSITPQKVARPASGPPA